APSAMPAGAQIGNWIASLDDPTAVEQVRYSYDARGTLLRETHFSGIAANPEGYTETSFVYDQAGRLLRRQTTGRNAETFVYDGLGRVVA
ncbi:hypothetical protein, partial [Escherichia coli]|uniref:hypothetical protein n=1 Tax=Escherichia coli TaxID=562 RepID=UPI0019343CED